MADQAKIREFLEGMSKGSRITIALKDGSEAEGSLAGLDGEWIRFEDDERDLRLDQVEHVMMRVFSIGPE